MCSLGMSIIISTDSMAKSSDFYIIVIESLFHASPQFGLTVCLLGLSALLPMYSLCQWLLHMWIGFRVVCIDFILGGLVMGGFLSA